MQISSGKSLDSSSSWKFFFLLCGSSCWFLNILSLLFFSGRFYIQTAHLNAAVYCALSRNTFHTLCIWKASLLCWIGCDCWGVWSVETFYHTLSIDSWLFWNFFNEVDFLQCSVHLVQPSSHIQHIHCDSCFISQIPRSLSLWLDASW